MPPHFTFKAVKTESNSFLQLQHTVAHHNQWKMSSNQTDHEEHNNNVKQSIETLSGWRLTVGGQLFQVSPEMFSLLQVWALAGPLIDIHRVLPKPILHRPVGM